jgi:SpoVK/Ycf46/Vps4 family AAA+-type ATPase
MFLTTNRGEIIDPAILSRVTIKLDYPDLDDTARDRIWHVMFKLVGQAIETTGTLPKLKINGRQIRNLMRLGVSMYGKQVTAEQIESLSEFTAK